MKCYRKIICLILSLALVVLPRCTKEDDPLTRGFYMGFTPFPYDLTLEAVNDVYSRILSDGDIVNHHFDNGVPWNEALNDLPFPGHIQDDWEFRKSKTPSSHKIYLSLTPLNFNRTGLAAYRGTSDNMELEVPWNAYHFNEIAVKTAYLNYCKRAIDFFQPDYFNMAIEANLYFVNASTTSWGEYLELHTFVYEELKSAYPDLPIFTSIVSAYLLHGFITGNDVVQHKLAVLQLLDHSDYFGISFYPYMSDYLGNPYPEEIFDELFSISPKPLAVAETGYVAQSFQIDTGNGVVEIESNQTKQEKYINDLLTAVEKRKTIFVINFVVRDYDQLWVQLGSPIDLFIAWRDSGLYDENGNARLAATTWRKFLGKKYQHQH